MNERSLTEEQCDSRIGSHLAAQRDELEREQDAWRRKQLEELTEAIAVAERLRVENGRLRRQVERLQEIESQFYALRDEVQEYGRQLDALGGR